MKENASPRESAENEETSADADPGSEEMLNKTLVGLDPLVFGPYALYFETTAFLNAEAYTDFPD